VLAALQPFGFPLAAWSRMPHALPGVESYRGTERLPAFLARSKMLIALLPSTDETRDLLDADALALLPSGAHIVNLGRGDLIVDTALIAALNRGHIAHATLDVFREEPLPPKHPFWHHSGHHGHAARVGGHAHRDSVAQVVAKIRALERGEIGHRRRRPRERILTMPPDCPRACASSTSARATACRTRRPSCRPRSRSR
jgi:glyoxylate/hydroxypyruvate reductase A